MIGVCDCCDGRDEYKAHIITCINKCSVLRINKLPYTSTIIHHHAINTSVTNRSDRFNISNTSNRDRRRTNLRFRNKYKQHSLHKDQQYGMIYLIFLS